MWHVAGWPLVRREWRGCRVQWVMRHVWHVSGSQSLSSSRPVNMSNMSTTSSNSRWDSVKRMRQYTPLIIQWNFKIKVSTFNLQERICYVFKKIYSFLTLKLVIQVWNYTRWIDCNKISENIFTVHSIVKSDIKPDPFFQLTLPWKSGQWKCDHSKCVQTITQKENKICLSVQVRSCSQHSHSMSQFVTGWLQHSSLEMIKCSRRMHWRTMEEI